MNYSLLMPFFLSYAKPLKPGKYQLFRIGGTVPQEFACMSTGKGEFLNSRIERCVWGVCIFVHVYLLRKIRKDFSFRYRQYVSFPTQSICTCKQQCLMYIIGTICLNQKQQGKKNINILPPHKIHNILSFVFHKPQFANRWQSRLLVYLQMHQTSFI